MRTLLYCWQCLFEAVLLGSADIFPILRFARYVEDVQIESDAADASENQTSLAHARVRRSYVVCRCLRACYRCVAFLLRSPFYSSTPNQVLSSGQLGDRIELQVLLKPFRE